MSRVDETINNTVKSSIKSMMDNQVTATLKVECTNEQTVVNANHCAISFADQVCNAVGTSNFAGTTTFNNESVQDIYNTITAKAESLTKGLTIGYSNSAASVNTMNYTEMAVDVTQKFYTDCSRDVRGINKQSAVNCDESLINFKPKSIT